MNNKAQITIISLIFSLIVFIILWAMFFGSWINEWAEKMVIQNSLTGLSAFLISNINIWVFIGLIIGMLIFMFVGGSQ